ncbi:hypothetical protein ABZO31_31595 [Streptomyces sp. HUAS MG47]|uniref:hypothetical protein n=1 Tax=Streptomyces solicamelliae TaxID=3231716 RepID=UPI003877AE78
MLDKVGHPFRVLEQALEQNLPPPVRRPVQCVHRPSAEQGVQYRAWYSAASANVLFVVEERDGGFAVENDPSPTKDPYRQRVARA